MRVADENYWWEMLMRITFENCWWEEFSLLWLQLILSAKVHVIRDAQILEKDLIRKEMDEETRRLDQMMEVERVNAIRIEEEIERQRKEERMIGALKIMEQIEENEQVPLLLLLH